MDCSFCVSTLLLAVLVLVLVLNLLFFYRTQTVWWKLDRFGTRLEINRIVLDCAGLR